MLTVERVKALLAVAGNADDALLGQLLESAVAFAAEYVGRSFAAGTYAESHPGGGFYLFLRHYPAAAVAVAGVDPAAYRLHGARGVVEAVREPFPRGESGELAVAVTLAEGATPPGVERAVVELVGHWLREAKTHAATGQLNLGSMRDDAGMTRSYPWGQSNGYRVPPSVIEALRRARGVAV